MTLQIAQTLDARNLSCPLPIVKTAIAIKSLAPGQLLEVLATDPGSTKDFAAWARTTGNDLIGSDVQGTVYRFVLRKK